MGILKRNLRRWQRRAERRAFDAVIGKAIATAMVVAVPAAGAAFVAVKDKAPDLIHGGLGVADTASWPLPPGGPTPDLNSLRVADPVAGPYLREEWQPHGWEDPDGDGCDAREQALRDASLDPPNVRAGCEIVAGRWAWVYLEEGTTNPGALDIDHLVSLGDASRSGGQDWPAARKVEFANDPLNLVPVHAGENRAKSDRSAAEWRPKNRGAWCLLGSRQVQVKAKYGLSVTVYEKLALGEMLATC